MPQIVIIGSGPTGLGAAYRLQELGYTDYVVLDKNNYAGGLGTSVMDAQGFVWDMGGHVIFSHYSYFDEALDATLGDEWQHHERESWVWMRNKFIAYPLQMNIRHLPKQELLECLEGLVECIRRPPEIKDFRTWILNKFGAGIAKHFMFPYNYKVWAYHPEKMDYQWMGERVATVDINRVLRNIVHETDDTSWGPNATFRFPTHRGTGNIWSTMASRLPSQNFRFGCEVVSIDSGVKQVQLQDGSSVQYDVLINTMPVDQLIVKIVDRPDLHCYAKNYVHSSTHIIGVGLDGRPPECLQGKCWMYFPEDDCPFYRVTLFSHYSPQNVPIPGKQWSLMCEVSESVDKAAPADVVAETIRGLKNVKFIQPSDVIVSIFHIRLEYGYPTPFLKRDDTIKVVDEKLRQVGIWSRGRFGAWKYEVANQDHSFMQGVEAADHILFGTEETTFMYPTVVNATKAPPRLKPLASFLSMHH